MEQHTLFYILILISDPEGVLPPLLLLLVVVKKHDDRFTILTS